MRKNSMSFDKYYFTDAFFEDNRANKIINIRFEKDDRFYSYLMPFLQKGKAESLTALTVDSLYVPKVNYDDLRGKTYTMTANAKFEQRQKDGSYLIFAGCVVVDRVCFENINPMNVKSVDDNWIKINMCDIEIQYQSTVQYGLFEDKEEE